MSKPQTIKIDEIEYVRADQVNIEPSTKQIVVLQRGWVVVGDVSKTETEVSIKNCSVIRIWGTSEGLGEIAFNGPTSKTKLDRCPDVTVHPLSIVLQMSVDEDRWK